MQSQEDKTAYERLIDKTCLYSNLIFLICHIAYLVFFLITEIYLLAWIDLGSTILYALLFVLVKYKKYAAYAIITGAEITAFMAFATAICGFQAGFHLCLIGLCILAFYSGYFSVNKSRIIKPHFWCLLMFMLYIFLYFYCLYNQPVYDLSIVVKSVLFVSHVVIVFGFITIFLYVFVRYVLRLEKRIINESRTDKLTQVANRYGLLDYMEAIEDKSNYYLSIFDIDDFKVVNDEYGHLCGDEILKEIAQIAMDIFKDDFVSRYGGEEFIVISRMDGDIKNAIEQVEAFRKTVEEHEFRFNNRIVKLTITIGLAAYGSEETIEEWIGKADKKLYFGKNSGKNQTVYVLK